MKDYVLSFGVVSLILLDLSLLFKILHWPGGNLLILFTLGLFIPVTIILAAIYLNKNKDCEK